MKKYQNRVSRGECLAGALLWTLVLAVQAGFFSMSDEAWSRRVWDMQLSWSCFRPHVVCCNGTAIGIAIIKKSMRTTV